MEQAVALRPTDLPMELSVQDLVAQVRKIQEVMKSCMKEDEHFGVIPGTKKPTLLKPGAEKLLLLFRFDPQYDSVERYDGDHLTVKTKCTLYHIPTSMRVGSGEGSCSTKESKYAFRNGTLSCPECGKEAIIKGKDEYGGGYLCYAKKGGCGSKFPDSEFDGVEVGKVAAENLADQYNTVLKMSNKRSLIAAVLNATAASDIFTQDTEDMQENGARFPGNSADKKKDAPASQRRQSAQTDAAPNVASGLVQRVDVKGGKGKDGKDWLRYGVVVDGATYGTFDATIGQFAQECEKKGDEINLYWTPNGSYKNIDQISRRGE